jgi:hypothetical protein
MLDKLKRYAPVIAMVVIIRLFGVVGWLLVVGLVWVGVNLYERRR